MTKINFICPFCKANLKNEGVTYVEDGVTNYLDYEWVKDREEKLGNGWELKGETNGENATETYYICKSCQKQLSDKYQDYFSNNL